MKRQLDVTDLVKGDSLAPSAFEAPRNAPAEDAATSLSDLAAEASALAETFEAVSELLNRLINTPEAFGRLVRIDFECHPAGGAVQLRARSELTDGARGLLAALRAGNINLRLVEHALRHPDLSCGLQPGVDAESSAEKTSPTTKPQEGAA